MPGVTGVSLNILGTGLVSRGQLTLPVTLKGVEPARLSAIAPIDETIVDGEPRLGLNDVLIGRKLAQDLGIRVGQPIFITSDQGRERTLTVRGLYSTGVDSLDARLAYVNLDTARVLFDLPEGLTEIEVKLADIYCRARGREAARRHHRARGQRLDGQEPAAARGARGAGQLGRHHQDVHAGHDRRRRGERAAADDVPPPPRDRHHAQLRHFAAFRAVGVPAAGRADRRHRLGGRLRARLGLQQRCSRSLTGAAAARCRWTRPSANTRSRCCSRPRPASARRSGRRARRRASIRSRRSRNELLAATAHRAMPRLRRPAATTQEVDMDAPLLEVRDLRKVFVDKDFPDPGAQGRELHARPRRDGGDARALGQRQEHAAVDPRHADEADLRQLSHARPRAHAARREGALGLPQPADRLHLPVPPPAAGLHGARERAVPARRARRPRNARRARARRDAARARGPQGAHELQAPRASRAARSSASRSRAR
jgi:hypothetical protein